MGEEEDGKDDEVLGNRGKNGSYFQEFLLRFFSDLSYSGRYNNEQSQKAQ